LRVIAQRSSPTSLLMRTRLPSGVRWIPDCGLRDRRRREDGKRDRDRGRDGGQASVEAFSGRIHGPFSSLVSRGEAIEMGGAPRKGYPAAVKRW
jgi:hypothetical protein